MTTRLEVVKSWFKTNRNFRSFKILIVMLIVLFLLNYALRSVAEALVYVL